MVPCWSIDLEKNTLELSDIANLHDKLEPILETLVAPIDHPD